MKRSLSYLLVLPLLSCAASPASQPKNASTDQQAHGGHEHAHDEHAHDEHAHDEHAHDEHAHDTPKAMGHRFEDADLWAKSFDAPARAAWQKPDEVVSHLALSPGMTVADVGAGTGYFLSRLSAAVGASGLVLGLDIEADMVRYMSERAQRDSLTNVEARLVPTDSPKLAAASVDRVLIVDTWHHIAERTSYAKELAAALRPQGSVFIVDFTMETARGPHRDHRLSAQSIVAELTAAGLQAEVIAEDLPDQFIVRGRLP